MEFTGSSRASEILEDQSFLRFDSGFLKRSQKECGRLKRWVIRTMELGFLERSNNGIRFRGNGIPKHNGLDNCPHDSFMIMTKVGVKVKCAILW